MDDGCESMTSPNISLPKKAEQKQYICTEDDLGALHDYCTVAILGNDICEIPRLWNQQMDVIRANPYNPAAGKIQWNELFDTFVCPFPLENGETHCRSRGKCLVDNLNTKSQKGSLAGDICFSMQEMLKVKAGKITASDKRIADVIAKLEQREKDAIKRYTDATTMNEETYQQGIAFAYNRAIALLREEAKK
jgi:hypothetical protein